MRVSDELIINAAVGLTNVFVYFKRVLGGRRWGGEGGGGPSPTRPEAHCYYRMATPGGQAKCVYRAKKKKKMKETRP